jgi:RHS repeat-associated protein
MGGARVSVIKFEKTKQVQLFTSPSSQPARKFNRVASLTLSQRLLYGRLQRNNTGKELDSETGLYYYGARYLDPRVSRWLSGDPALGEYVPVAPVSDEARKRNGNLPGMGGVFNYVNLHVYYYAGNNPVRYTDPDGMDDEPPGPPPSNIPETGSEGWTGAFN